MGITHLRQEYHARLFSSVIRFSSSRSGLQYPNFADSGSTSSVAIAGNLVRQLGYEVGVGIVQGQITGGRFETLTKEFIEQSFQLLQHLRPGSWYYSTYAPISDFGQYAHLATLETLIKENNELATALGKDYIVRPDILISRSPVSDEEINAFGDVVDAGNAVSRLTVLRGSNYQQSYRILHASISCKWTIRSDRAQNARTEALNLIRNRKGHMPHVVVVTAEPLPTRISALALGTGDLDCVYHFALIELIEAVREVGNQDQLEVLEMLVEGHRLRDISDLPFDLAT